jgi:miniconductance mechanosensitive channel
MSMMVRMMEPQSEGIPVEVYCFTAVTAWSQYERIQGDVFDHLLSILPEMGLRLYQAPSGADMSGLVSGRIGGGAGSASSPSAIGSAESGRLRGELPTL